MKKVLLIIAVSLLIVSCQEEKYPDNFVDDLPFNLKYNMSQKMTLEILDSLVSSEKLSIPYQGSESYNYQLQLEKPITLSITPSFHNDSLYSIDIREGSFNNKSDKENYNNAIAFFKNQKINLNSYSKTNDKGWKNYTWNSNSKKYEISLLYNKSLIMVFKDGHISERILKASIEEGMKKARAKTDKKLGGMDVQNSSFDGSVRQVEKYLKSNLKDPNSYESIDWSQVKETENGYEVRHKYRAKNSLGGYMIENHIFYIDLKGNVIKVE